MPRTVGKSANLPVIVGGMEDLWNMDQSSCSISQHFSCCCIFVYLPEIIRIERKLDEDACDFHLVFHNWKIVTISHILLSVFYSAEYFQEYLKSSIYLPSIFCSTKLAKWCSAGIG